MKKFLKIKNKCGMDLSETEELFHDLGGFAQKRFGFKRPPTLHLVSDQENSTKPLGKTAYYDPQSSAVTIYTDNRHVKDILRSLAHELVHHTQNENGMLNDSGHHGAGYAQKNKNLRNSEKEAYLKGNMCFRDWEDGLKQSKPTIYNEWRNKNMSIKKWKNNELMENLSEKFGFKMNLKNLNESSEKQYDLEENQDRIFAPNHYCLHHVIYEGKEGHTIDHNWNKKLQKVTKYDVKFTDGTIVRNIHESKLTVLEAFNEADHKRDDHPPVKEEQEESYHVHSGQEQRGYLLDNGDWLPLGSPQAKAHEAEMLKQFRMQAEPKATAMTPHDPKKIQRIGNDGESKPMFPDMIKEEEDKKPDEDGDGVPDYADKKPGKDDKEEADNKDKKFKPKKGVLPPQFAKNKKETKNESRMVKIIKNEIRKQFKERK
jgi:hypothetical protein